MRLEETMKRSRLSEEQIIEALKQADARASRTSAANSE
jgi:hypothetical protein